MPNIHVGKMIYQLRKQKGISQEELADGITDRANLSRIESGAIIPTKKVMEALFERLYYDPNNSIISFLDNELSKHQQMMDELESHIKNKRIGEAEALLYELEKDSKYMEVSCQRQFVMSAKTAIAMHNNEDTSVIFTMLHDVIKLTIPTFSEKYIEDYFLTAQEMRIINMMAVNYYHAGHLNNAIKIMYSLKNNFDKNCIDNNYKGKHYPLIIYNLTDYLVKAKRYNEATKICEIGKQLCIDTGFLFYLPLIIMNKVICLYEIGDIESSKKQIYQAYYCCESFSMFEDKEKIKSYAKEKLRIKL